MKEKETLLDKITKVINFAGSVILMNLLFLVACLPVVTIGAAWSGLVTALRYNIRGDSWFQGFKFGFTTRFWRSTICWVLLAAGTLYLLLDVNHALSVMLPAFEQNFQAVLTSPALVPLIAAVLMATLAGMLTVSFLILNVYIPTGVGRWIENAVNMVFKAPLQLIAAAILFWLPVVMVMFLTGYFALSALVWVCAYFTIAALVTTFLLKQTLLEYLVAAREEGVLLAEEGRFRYGDYEEEE